MSVLALQLIGTPVLVLAVSTAAAGRLVTALGGPCPCECNSRPDRFCGGCGHAGCGGRQR